MHDFADIAELYIEMVDRFRRAEFSLDTHLLKIVLISSFNNVAYIDNRKEAKYEFNLDFWKYLYKRHNNESEAVFWLNAMGISKNVLYSKSDQFPDIVFKSRTDEGNLKCGSLLELKDAKSSTISSFNSTLPTKQKNLQELDVINGNNLVSKIVKIHNDKSDDDEFYEYTRHCFYLIRTGRGNPNKTKISLVDGSFFETIPTDNLIAQTFLTILKDHHEKKSKKLTDKEYRYIEEILSYLDDHTLISSSKSIENASVKPRLRLMAEVHPEGNPHSSHYPQILDRTINFIIREKDHQGLENEFGKELSGMNRLGINHKRNGKYIVFQHKFY